jgi:hypothetical protein
LHQFEGDIGIKLTLNARARQFGVFLVLVGAVTGAGLFEPKFGVICQNKDDLTIPLKLDMIPSLSEFKTAVGSVSAEQQSFAQQYRSAQLASSVLAVCVIQVKPLLEKVLNLAESSLIREVALTQDLLELFVVYQIPPDLLSYVGSSDDKEVQVEKVKLQLRRVQLLIEAEKVRDLIESHDEAVRIEKTRRPTKLATVFEYLGFSVTFFYCKKSYG